MNAKFPEHRSSKKTTVETHEHDGRTKQNATVDAAAVQGHPDAASEDNNRNGGTETPSSYAAVPASKPAPQNNHSTDDDGFIKCTAKRNRQNAPITGNANSGTLKGVNKNGQFHLFVTRLHPDTTEEDITNVPAEVGIQASCERLETRYSSYASYLCHAPETETEARC